jgi:hypothetical protein
MTAKNYLRVVVVVAAAGSQFGLLAALDTNQIEQLTGLKGKWNAEESVFKVTSPRADVKVTRGAMADASIYGADFLGRVQVRPERERDGNGDLVLFQDEANPVMSVLFENGVEVTALHNHFFFDHPKVYFMHIGGEGTLTQLGAE